MKALASTVVASIIGLGVLSASVSDACSQCSTDNPSLSLLAQDVPQLGKVRLAVTVRSWGQEEPNFENHVHNHSASGAADAGTIRIRELRSDLAASWSPSERYTFLLNVPLQLRDVGQSAIVRTRGLGDADVNAKFVAYRDAIVGARSLVSLLAGVRLPTAPRLFDSSGVAQSSHSQLGGGSFVPQLGITASAVLSKWSAHAAIRGEAPLIGWNRDRAPLAARSSLILQHQPLPFLAARLGTEFLAQGPQQLAGLHNPSTRGTFLFATGDVVVQPSSRFTLVAGARVPFIQRSEGSIRLSPIFLGSFLAEL